VSSSSTKSEETGGRRVFLLVAGFVVLVGALIGLFVGANSAERGTDVTVLGSVTLPTSPVAVAVYGGLLAAVVMVVLFGAVEAASRLEAS
jgi:hypothetical protein